ncbi:MAG: glycosyltransferase family 39 protein [Bacteroidales bacterium]|nr:glycosyltransferase family 39 protein [Bacteroidales bacterium]
MVMEPDNGILSSFSSKKILLYFLFFWLILNLLQAFYTGLFKDEAYYFFYSRHLAWGYYDHPPLPALLIRIGYFLFNNELGVRLLVVLLSAVTLLMLQRLARNVHFGLYAILFLSFPVFHITGFMAIPDALLVFFTALFFLTYRKFAHNRSVLNAVILGIVMAGMFYSKYLGIIIIFFTVLSDLRLLGSFKFWLAVAVTTLLFMPHLVWQYIHDFPTFYYHLLERSHDEFFEWVNFGDYLAGQAAMVNPLLFIPVIWHLFRFKPENEYERALKFSAAGSLLLPLLLMLRGRVEANWTIAGLVPLFIIACIAFERHIKLKRYLNYAFGISFVLILAARLMLVIDIIPEPYRDKIHIESHGWKEFAEEVNRRAGERPVVFVSSYQNASEYRFYTGKEAFSYNSEMYRSNQYDLVGIERGLQGREVLVVISGKDLTEEDIREHNLALSDSIRIPGGRYQYHLIQQDYRSYNYLPIEVLSKPITLQAGTLLEIPISLKNPDGLPVYFGEDDRPGVSLYWVLLQYGKPVSASQFEDLSGLLPEQEYSTSFLLEAPQKPGTYYLRISIKSGWLPPGINSRIIKVKVT